MSTSVKISIHQGWEKNLDISSVYSDVAPRIVETVARLAPVDSGELRDSIDWIEVGGFTALPTLYIYADAEHAPFVELGTANMSAQPYLRPGVMRKWL